MADTRTKSQTRKNAANRWKIEVPTQGTVTSDRDRSWYAETDARVDEWWGGEPSANGVYGLYSEPMDGTRRDGMYVVLAVCFRNGGDRDA